MSNKETGPMVKVLAWSHFRKTVVWIDDFETTGEELIAKLAINLQVLKTSASKMEQAVTWMM